MKKSTSLPLVLFILLLIYSSVIFPQEKPISGNSFKISYNPIDKNILTDSKQITLVYVFEDWGSFSTPPQSPSDLFRKVLNPDSNKVKKLDMKKEGNLWTALINIPEKASILSYYFSDGTKSDYNDKKTYVSYIYDKNMKPVRNARFSNVDFMFMAGNSLDAQIKELSLELDDYPDNFNAHFAYLSKKIDNINDYQSLMQNEQMIAEYFTKLENKYPGNYEVLNAKAKTYNKFNTAIYMFFYKDSHRIDEIFRTILHSIPPEKMSPFIRRFYDEMQKAKEYDEFQKNLLGTEAADFQFETLTGEKHKLSEYRGKYVLLDFWGTWCGPCVEEIPYLKKAYDAYKDKGLVMISISSDAIQANRNADYVKKFTKEKGMLWQQVLDSNIIHSIYKVNSWPSIYLINKEGKIIFNDFKLRGAELAKTLGEIFRNENN